MVNVSYSKVIGSLIYCMFGIRPKVTIVMGIVVQIFNNLRLAHCSQETFEIFTRLTKNLCYNTLLIVLT